MPFWLFPLAALRSEQTVNEVAAASFLLPLPYTLIPLLAAVDYDSGERKTQINYYFEGRFLPLFHYLKTKKISWQYGQYDTYGVGRRYNHI